MSWDLWGLDDQTAGIPDRTSAASPYVDQPWEDHPGGAGWTHPTGFEIHPSDEIPGHHQLWAPVTTFRGGDGGGLAKVKPPHRDPRVLMDFAMQTQGKPRQAQRVDAGNRGYQEDPEDRFWGSGGCGALALALKNIHPHLGLGVEWDQHPALPEGAQPDINHVWVYDEQTGNSHDWRGTHQGIDAASPRSTHGRIELGVDPSRVAGAMGLEWSPDEPWSDEMVDQASGYFPDSRTGIKPRHQAQRVARANFPYVRNNGGVRKYSPEGFGQKHEPWGRYMSPDVDGHKIPLQPGWERGQVGFENPYYIPHEYGDWKQNLSQEHGGLTGKELSRALMEKGYDGVISHDKYGLGEIVDIRPKNQRGHQVHSRIAGANGDRPPMTMEPFNTPWSNGVMARHAGDGRPLGHLHWYPDGEIETVRTHPDFLRRGVATAMLKHAQAYPDVYHSDKTIHHSNQLTGSGRGWANSDQAWSDPGDEHVQEADPDVSNWGHTAVRDYVPAHMPYTGQNEAEMAKHLKPEHQAPYSTKVPYVKKASGPRHLWPDWHEGNHPDVPFDKRWSPNHSEHQPGPWSS